jgi:hypothetical protein
MLTLAIRLRQWGWDRAADFLIALESRIARLGRADRMIRRARRLRQSKPPVDTSLQVGAI